MTVYKAFVTDKKTGNRVIIEQEHSSKSKFIEECRLNGYRVNTNRVVTKEQYDWIAAHTNMDDGDFKNVKTLMEEYY